MASSRSGDRALGDRREASPRERSATAAATLASDLGEECAVMSQLRIDVDPRNEPIVTVAVHGEIDMATAPDLTTCLIDLRDHDVVVDLSDVGFLDSSGVSALLYGVRALQETGHTLRTTGEQEHVQRVLEIAGVAELLHPERS
jgi:anti-anti-sigma factor